MKKVQQRRCVAQTQSVSSVRAPTLQTLTVELYSI